MSLATVMRRDPPKATKELSRKRITQMAAEITQTTPVSIALVIGLCGCAFYTGSQVSSLSTKIEYTAEEQRDMKKLIKEISILSADNKRRLDHIRTQGHNSGSQMIK